MDAGGERFDSSPRPHHVEAVREARIDEWKQSRTLRLEMLADTPHAFGDRLADVLHWDDEQWRIRHYSHLLPDSAVFVAVERDGRWVGQMEAREFHDHTPARVWLMGVYVTPAHRGNGTATALLEAVEQWVRGAASGSCTWMSTSIPVLRAGSTSARASSRQAPQRPTRWTRRRRSRRW